MMPTLGELSRLIRSKNAGPFLVTFDIMLKDEAAYRQVKESRVISKPLIARLYNTREEDVRIIVYPPAHAIKVTIPRRIPAGDPIDADIFGAQMHAPLVDLSVG